MLLYTVDDLKTMINGLCDTIRILMLSENFASPDVNCLIEDSLVTITFPIHFVIYVGTKLQN